MAMRNADAQPPPAPAASAFARQIGGSPGFIDENELPRIEVELRPKPRLTLLQDVRALLLLGMRGLFFNMISWRSKKRQITDEEKTLAAVGDQTLLDFQQRHIRLTANQTEQIIAMRLNAVRPTIPARRSRGDLAGRPEPPNPAYGAGDADPETLGRRIARHAPF